MPRKNFADESGLKREAWLTRSRNVEFSAKKSENVHVPPKPSVRLSDTGVSSCRTPTEIYNHNNNHDTNSRRPEIGFKSSVVGRNDAKESSPDDNTVLMAQVPPRGASAHARYLVASKISARQDGRTVLRTRLVFAVSPRSALSHSNLATCFQAMCYIIHLSVKYGILR